MRVLIVEPAIDFGRLLCKKMKTHNLKSDLAHSAQQALHLADKNKPNVVILELNLASHNGLEFLYELRSYQDWQNIPVIIYSHLTPEETGLNKNAQQRLGITDYLYKPISNLEKLTTSVLGVTVEPTV